MPAAPATPAVTCAAEPDLAPAEFRRVLLSSGLGATRPVDDAERLATMLAKADVVLAARRADLPGRPLVGVARCITDFSWCCFVAELAVCADAQGLGVGRRMLDELRRLLGPRVSINLFSMPDATGFYQRIGMARMDEAFSFKRSE
jgi:GNAT superfamily N-acetyltransferase